MIAATIGKIFLRAYNRKYGENYDARTFFVEKYYPLFFDHEKYLQWVTNSPFVQGIKKGTPPTAEERRAKLQTLLDKIEGSEADASIAIGFPSLDPSATTSGQITNLQLPISKDDVYLSWIGSGLGVGVQGGLSILFTNEDVLMAIFEGWQVYRDNLEQMPLLRGNQINTWNGQWLVNRYREDFQEEYPCMGFDPFEATKDGMEVPTQSWTKILLAIARKMPQVQMMGYVYNLGQTNTTVGFVPFILPEIKRTSDLYEKLFGTKDVKRAEALFGTAWGFLHACQQGVVGVKALEPKGMREFMSQGKIPSYDEDDENKIISFNTYQIWILAMLNNDELWVKTQEIANVLCDYESGAVKAKTNRTNNVKAVLSSTNWKNCLEELCTVVEDVEDVEKIEAFAKELCSMPADNVPYFLALLRFQYAVAKRKHSR